MLLTARFGTVGTEEPTEIARWIRGRILLCQESGRCRRHYRRATIRLPVRLAERVLFAPETALNGATRRGAGAEERADGPCEQGRYFPLAIYASSRRAFGSITGPKRQRRSGAVVRERLEATVCQRPRDHEVVLDELEGCLVRFGERTGLEPRQQHRSAETQQNADDGDAQSRRFAQRPQA
jgi:hypothetical protein